MTTQVTKVVKILSIIATVSHRFYVNLLQKRYVN